MAMWAGLNVAAGDGIIRRLGPGRTSIVFGGNPLNDDRGKEDCGRDQRTGFLTLETSLQPQKLTVTIAAHQTDPAWLTIK
jgi:hypothetical protein